MRSSMLRLAWKFSKRIQTTELFRAALHLQLI
jgi:hypothetical protein